MRLKSIGKGLALTGLKIRGFMKVYTRQCSNTEGFMSAKVKEILQNNNPFTLNSSKNTDSQESRVKGFLNTDDLAQTLKQFTTYEQFRSFLSQNTQELQQDMQLSLLYLDFLADMHNKTPSQSDVSFASPLIDSLTESLSVMDPFYIVSLIESLSKLQHNRQDKIWLKLQYLILRTDLVSKLDLKMHKIILKAFEGFFAYKVSSGTVDPEEVYEKVEYEILLRTANTKESLLDCCEVFLLFGKNLEGSSALYLKLLERIYFGLEEIFTKDKVLYVQIYYTTILIQDFVFYRKNRLERVLKQQEKLIISKFDDFVKGITHNELYITMAIWSLDRRNLSRYALSLI